MISNLEGWVLAAGPMVLVHIECIWTHHSITALLVTVVSQSWPRFLQKIEDFFGQINFSTKLLRWWFHEIFERFAKNAQCDSLTNLLSRFLDKKFQNFPWNQHFSRFTNETTFLKWKIHIFRAKLRRSDLNTSVSTAGMGGCDSREKVWISWF